MGGKAYGLDLRAGRRDSFDRYRLRHDCNADERRDVADVTQREDTTRQTMYMVHVKAHG
jgi:hypothetical protein